MRNEAHGMRNEAHGKCPQGPSQWGGAYIQWDGAYIYRPSGCSTVGLREFDRLLDCGILLLMK